MKPFLAASFTFHNVTKRYFLDIIELYKLGNKGLVGVTTELRRYLDDLIKRIGQEIPVEEIFLFGSYAYGTPNEDSDIDLCILAKLNGHRKVDLIRRARKAIAPIAFYPVDILVYDKDDFMRRSNVGSTLEYKIKNEGVKVYGC